MLPPALITSNHRHLPVNSALKSVESQNSPFFSLHTQKSVEPCWFHLQNIFRIGYLLAAPTATTLIPAPSGATPRSRWQLFRLLLQSLLHVAAQEDVCNTFTGMTVPLAILSWLPIPREIKFTPNLVFKALQIWFHLYFQTWLQSFFPTNIH